jgi:hypothetical protein
MASNTRPAGVGSVEEQLNARVRDCKQEEERTRAEYRAYTVSTEAIPDPPDIWARRQELRARYERWRTARLSLADARGRLEGWNTMTPEQQAEDLAENGAMDFLSDDGWTVQKGIAAMLCHDQIFAFEDGSE